MVKISSLGQFLLQSVLPVFVFVCPLVLFTCFVFETASSLSLLIVYISILALVIVLLILFLAAINSDTVSRLRFLQRIQLLCCVYVSILIVCIYTVWLHLFPLFSFYFANLLGRRIDFHCSAIFAFIVLSFESSFLSQIFFSFLSWIIFVAVHRLFRSTCFAFLRIFCIFSLFQSHFPSSFYLFIYLYSSWLRIAISRSSFTPL